MSIKATGPGNKGGENERERNLDRISRLPQRHIKRVASPQPFSNISQLGSASPRVLAASRPLIHWLAHKVASVIPCDSDVTVHRKSEAYKRRFDCYILFGDG